MESAFPPTTMRNAIPLVLSLAVAALLLWMLAAGGDDVTSTLGPEGEQPGPSEGDPTDLAAPPTMAGRDPPPAERPPRGRSIDERTLPRGRIDVLPVGPDLASLSADRLTVYVEPTGGRDRRRQLGARDRESGVWSWPKMLAGEVEIRVFGDHVREARKRAVVKANAKVDVTVHVDLGGAIGYDVLLPDKSRPKRVTVTLYGANDKPFEAVFQARGRRYRTSPRRATSALLGPEGVIYDLPAGRYRVRVESESGSYEDLDVDVEAGRTRSVTFRLRG